MPAGDRTGPMGREARSGRGAGFCSGFGVQRYVNQAQKVGFGGRFSNWFRGWRRRAGTTGQPGSMRGGLGEFFPGSMASGQDTEKQMLKQEIEGLQLELQRVKSRLNEI